MARALGEVHPQELRGLEGVLERGSGYRYELDASGAIVETRPDVPEHRRSAELVFAIGAGELDRSFAAQLGDFLWFAPLEVVTTEQGRRAALAPGHMIRPGTRFATAITPECLGCHTDAPPPRAFPLNLRPASGTWTPRGISCAHAPYSRCVSAFCCVMPHCSHCSHPLGDTPLQSRPEIPSVLRASGSW